ncbi:MAG TPA: pectinesterase family protein, partial [Paludibacter sp.]|nr:pectinesterase family protein [Paludibacter sp.]
MKQIFLLFLLSICLGANAQPFRFIVAADGTGNYTTIQAALDACPDGVQSLVFVKNGTYNEQVSLGSKTLASTKKISLIGESAAGVVITHSQSRAASGSPTFEDICTVKIYATDFYAENITIQNTAGNTGMAEALYTAGDRQTFKNCRILGYQDTYRSKKGTRGYFKNCWIEGAVDFIYAGGTLFFDDCNINCVKGGGYIVAPEDAYATIPKASTVIQKFLRLGFIFRNCNIIANSDVSASSYTLGRPWNTNAGAFYLNCKLGNHIKSAGWTVMGGNETSACFAEYNSIDANGNPIDITGRISWSFQLPKADVDSFLTPAKVYAASYTTGYNPVSLCISPLS